MPHAWKSLISILSEIATQKPAQAICCPCCGNRERTTKYGFYERYNFDEQALVSIQRFRCDNDQCPRRTFSVLPHPFLRVLRASLCMFRFILSLWESGQSIALVARKTGQTWPRIQRWISRAEDIRSRLGSDDAFSALPCLKPIQGWTEFVRDFSHACYPGRI